MTAMPVPRELIWHASHQYDPACPMCPGETVPTTAPVTEEVLELLPYLNGLSLDERVTAINQIRLALHDLSPFKEEPVDCVIWVASEHIIANDYNPNAVAPPEMKLLELSILSDGYTQPIVAWEVETGFEVVDGFHRHRVGRESAEVRERIHGYLPLAVIREDREDRGDRIAATIRHNRARGKHQVSAMSDIVVELKRRNWSDAKIGKQLGMDPDEVLRLSQISGLAEMFADGSFSEAWEADLAATIDDADDLVDVEP
jgi:ParB-like chromosome segregation protein Spo0J